MKLFFIISFILILPVVALSQDSLRFCLTLGSSTNDQAEKKFTYEERKWEVEGRTLIYNIDAHGMRYTDTLKLQDSIYSKLASFIKENGLLQDYEVKLESPYSEKYEYSEFVNAKIYSAGKEYLISIKGEGYGQIDGNKVVVKLKELEQMLYKVVE